MSGRVFVPRDLVDEGEPSVRAHLRANGIDPDGVLVQVLAEDSDGTWVTQVHHCACCTVVEVVEAGAFCRSCRRREADEAEGIPTL